MATTYIALGPNAWGKAPTLAKAKKVMKEYCYLHGKQPYVVLRVEGEFLGINTLHGDVRYNGTCEEVEKGTFMARG